MLNFVFHSPTKVIFGKDTETSVGEEIKSLGYKKVLVHYGSGSAVKSGLIDRIYASLKAQGIAYVSLGGVQPNPVLSLVRQGVELAKKENVDFILAVGGGSVIDSSKAIAYGITHDFDVWDLFEHGKKASACAPLGAVLTIAAAGSETSNSCVITNEDGLKKRSYNDDISRPKFAVMNPELTYTLPEYQTMSGIVDILMHTMERYFTHVKDVELIDRMSEGLMVTVIENAYRLLENPKDYNARAEIMWAGSISHNGFTGTGRVGDFATHQMEHELSAVYGVAHGAGLSALWPSWARYMYKQDIPRYAQFAARVMGCTANYYNLEETALRGIEAMEAFYKKIKMPVTISELLGRETTDAEIEELAKRCSFAGKRTVGNCFPLDEKAMKEIYTMAK